MILLSAGFTEDLAKQKRITLNLQKKGQFIKVFNLFSKTSDFWNKSDTKKNFAVSNKLNKQIKLKICQPFYISTDEIKSDIKDNTTKSSEPKIKIGEVKKVLKVKSTT